MLDLLLAAIQAADTEERRWMLDGLLENQDRDLQRAFESGVDHGELLDDDFFWCFMGLAGLHGDRAAWRVLRDYGYGMDTLITPPPEDDGFVGLPAQGTPLGVWLAQFAPIERLQYLQEEGLLHPWKTTTRVADQHLSAGEMGMLTGSKEHFDYWVAQWKEHAAQEWKDRQRRGNPAVSLPSFLGLAHGMLTWSQQAPSEQLESYPNHWPKTVEMERRIDAVLQAWSELHYPGLDEEKRLETLLRKPPMCFHAEAGAIDGFLRWQLARIDRPFDQPLEDLALGEASEAWLVGLLNHGLPLKRPQSKHPTALASQLAWRHASTAGSDKRGMACRIFVERAQEEDPEALEAFLTQPISRSTKTPGEPAVFAALDHKNWDAVGRLLDWAIPTGLCDGEGKNLGERLLGAYVRNCDNGTAAAKTFKNFQAWTNRASDEEKALAFGDSQTYPVKENSRKKDLPEFVLLENGKAKPLAWLIQNGLPIDRRDRNDMALGWVMLHRAGEHGLLDSTLWSAFRDKALKDQDRQLPDRYLHSEPEQLVKEFKTNPDLALRTLKAGWLDSRWEASNLPASRPKPRM